MKYLYLFFFSATLLLLIGCKETTTSPVIKDIQSISIENVPPFIYATRNSVQLKATAHYDDGSDADITEAAAWRFVGENDYSEATLFYGLITPKQNGDGNGSEALLEFEISYKELADNGSLRIIPATALTIDDTNITDTNNIKVDDNYTFSVDINYSDGTFAKADENHSNSLIWSATGSAEVLNQENGVATIHFTQTGEANISITFHSLSDLRTYTVSQ